MPLDQSPEVLVERGGYEVQAEDEQPYLRHLHVAHASFEVYLFVNEHPYRSIDTTVHLPGHRRVLRYDAWDNRVTEANAQGARRRPSGPAS